MIRWPLLGKALRSISLRWALALLLLAAQQGALTHALGHAAGHAHEPIAVLHDHDHSAADHADDDSDEPVTRLASEQCAFDLVYSQVLGGLHAGHWLHLEASDPVVNDVFAWSTRSAPAGLPYNSRAPPVFS